MKKQSSIDRIAYAARAGELSIDAAVAAATAAILDDAFLREAAVKQIIAQVMMGKWEWDEPPLSKMISDSEEIRAKLRERREAGKRIDPENADVRVWWVSPLDPYNVRRDIPDELKQSRPEYFARKFDDDWVSFHDLPEATRYALLRKMDAGVGQNGELYWQIREVPIPF